MKPTDKSLLEAIALKDEKAFNEFYKRYSSILYRWALNRIGNADIANDIAQEFWSNLWINPLSIKTNEEGVAKNFLLHFFTFRVLDYLRANAKEKSVSTEEQLEVLKNTMSYTHILEEIHEKEIHSLIDEVLQDLPELTRMVFDYRWKRNYSIKETSEKLGVDEKVVYNRTFTALSLIRTRVNEMLSDEKVINDPKTLLGLAILLNSIS
jgi:RNA polymerase sigma factor (sigma-70 family)